VRDVMLRAAGVRKTLGTNLVLDDVSLDVCRGDIVGLLGANGAGKTTLIRIAMGLMDPDGGVVDGLAPMGTATVGFLPEERGLYQRHRVDATLMYLAELKGIAGAAAVAAVERSLERVQMTALRTRRIEQLSKGQQQKVQIAAAWLGDPDLLVLDEPFSGLDPLNARLVCDLSLDAADRGRGVLLSAHQLALVDQVCSRIVMLAHGRVVFAGSIEEVRQRGERALEDLFVEDVRTVTTIGGGR
jgi:ABC-2 type transport system ATP-binding protein